MYLVYVMRSGNYMKEINGIEDEIDNIGDLTADGTCCIIANELEDLEDLGIDMASLIPANPAKNEIPEPDETSPDEEDEGADSDEFDSFSEQEFGGQ